MFKKLFPNDYINRVCGSAGSTFDNDENQLRVIKTSDNHYTYNCVLCVGNKVSKTKFHPPPFLTIQCIIDHNNSNLVSGNHRFAVMDRSCYIVCRILVSILIKSYSDWTLFLLVSCKTKFQRRIYYSQLNFKNQYGSSCNHSYQAGTPTHHTIPQLYQESEQVYAQYTIQL